MSSKREKRQRWLIQQHIIKYWTQWLLCKMNRQENSRSTRVSCVPKMKSLTENNGSALRQMAHRKRRRTRKRALITIKQRTKQMLELWQMQAWRSEIRNQSGSTYLICFDPEGQQRFGTLNAPSSPGFLPSKLINHCAWQRKFMGCSSQWTHTDVAMGNESPPAPALAIMLKITIQCLTKQRI